VSARGKRAATCGSATWLQEPEQRLAIFLSCASRERRCSGARRQPRGLSTRTWSPKVAAPAVELARIELHRGLRPTKRDRRRLDAIKADDV